MSLRFIAYAAWMGCDIIRHVVAAIGEWFQLAGNIQLSNQHIRKLVIAMLLSDVEEMISTECSNRILDTYHVTPEDFRF